MDKNRYKAAFDAVKFSDDFERNTIERMRRAAERKTKKEDDPLKTRKIIRLSILVAALCALLAATALALTALLSPKEVAAQGGNMALAEAFDSEEAVLIDQTAQTGDYTITLLGIVSGKGLTQYDNEAQSDKSYIVASVAYTDGRRIEEAGDMGITLSPLVSGYKPWQVNAWTLGGGYSAFVYEGVNYFIFDCANLDIFADHTVYLAAYEGFVPNAQIFTMNDNGEIDFARDFDKPHAMFTLPLDPEKADPEAVSSLLESAGIVIE